MDALLPSTLRGRVLFLIVLAFLPAVSILAYSYGELRELAERSEQQDALRMAEVVAADYQRLVDETRILLESLAGLDEIRNVDRDRCHRTLTQVLEANPRYTSLAVIDADGYRLCGALQVENPLYLGDRSYVMRATGTKRFAVGDYQIGRITGTPTVGLALPFLDEDGNVTGTLATSLDLEQLREHASSRQLPPGATLTLVDRSGMVLVREPGPREAVGTEIPEAFPTGAADTVVDSLMTGTDLDGSARTFAVRPLQGEGESPEGILALGIDPDQAGAVRQIFVRQLFALGAGALLVLVLAWVLGHRWIVRPVDAIVAAEDELRKGNLGSRVTLGGGPRELTRIARAFNEMASEIQTRSEGPGG